jgi:hypothetical protein
MAITTPANAPALTDEQLVDMLGLMSGCDSVELKLSIPMAQQRSAVEALGLDPLEAQVRLVHFYDTPDLKLNKAGVVVRARRVQGRGDDTVVKLRPVIPAELPDDLRENPGFFVEVDAMPGKYVCSASLKGVARRASVREVALGERPIRKLFGKDQRAFYRAHAPDGLELDDLTLLGPIFVLKVKGTPEGFARKLVVELWLFPDGSRVLELSTKCAPSEAFDVAAYARAFLSERGIRRVGGQTTKTAKALTLFSKEAAAKGRRR